MQRSYNLLIHPIAGAATFFALIAATHAWAAPTYMIINLGTLGGVSEALAISNSG